jgi:hypothetical protein
VALAALALAPSAALATRFDGGVRGITLAPIEDARLGEVGYGSDRSELALEEIVGLGAGWISLTPFGRMDDLGSTEILHDFEIEIERNERLIAATTRAAHDLGLRVALIPHVYVMSGEWRGRIDPGDADAVEQWFAAYERFLARFARLAEKEGVDLFSIGVEFVSTTNFFPERWRRTIAMAREEYRGPLTYSANWDEVEYVEFWDSLDAIGINAFWPLAREPGHGYEELEAGARVVADEIAGLAFYWDRPVIFTEFGVKTARDAALAPWEWPEHCKDLAYDEVYQAEAYDAVFGAVIDEWWFAGLFIWKYFSDPWDDTQEAPTGFSPRGKLAEESLARWFARMGEVGVSGSSL